MSFLNPFPSQLFLDNVRYMFSSCNAPFLYASCLLLFSCDYALATKTTVGDVEFSFMKEYIICMYFVNGILSLYYDASHSIAQYKNTLV